KRDTFCTALFCTLFSAPDGFTLAVTAGGHPLPVVVRSDWNSETVGRPGIIVGAFEDASWNTAATHLRSGDTIVLYTDGITDVSPSHGGGIDDVQALVQRAAATSSNADDIATKL